MTWREIKAFLESKNIKDEDAVFFIDSHFGPEPVTVEQGKHGWEIS